MNIIEALKSGKPFRRKGWVHADYWIIGGGPHAYAGGEMSNLMIVCTMIGVPIGMIVIMKYILKW